MWGKFYLAFVIAAIGGTILSFTEVDAHTEEEACASRQALASNMLCEY